jgi:hypothetical protein
MCGVGRVVNRPAFYLYQRRRLLLLIKYSKEFVQVSLG